MSAEIQDLISRYATGGDELAASIFGLSREQLRARPIPGKWSIHEVICHLADFEPIHLDRMKRIIAEESPTLFNGDENLFARRLFYEQRETEHDLALVMATRRHLSTLLRSLEIADFQRLGIHSENGPLPLQKYLSNAVVHIPHHIAFIDQKRIALGVPRK